MRDFGRRGVIGLAGGAASWPLAARAQQRERMPVIGFLHSASPDGNPARVRAFREGLREAGFVEGESVAIEYRWAENQLDRLPALADELVRRRVAVLVAPAGPPVVFPAKAATKTIPIVFIVAEDPAKLGLVASLNRPGGNLTGINLFIGELAAKRLALLRALVPAATRLAVLINPSGPNAERTMRDLEPAARAMGLQIQVLKATSSSEINAAFTTFVRERLDALFVNLDPFFTSRRVQLATLATRHAIPMTSGNRQITEAGGLMSYGSNIADAYRQDGIYVGRILNGT